MIAYILMQLRECKESIVLDYIKSLDEVKDAAILFGEWDLLAKVQVENSDSLSTFLLEKIRQNPDIRLTSSLIVAK